MDGEIFGWGSRKNSEAKENGRPFPERPRRPNDPPRILQDYTRICQAGESPGLNESAYVKTFPGDAPIGKWRGFAGGTRIVGT